MNARRTAAAIAYCALLIGLTWASAHLIPHQGACKDVWAFGIVQARTSLGVFLPIPVVQLCSSEIAASILILGVIAASFAWSVLIRCTPPAWMIAACMLVGLGSSLAFPYVATTDPYAYAVYGYKALLGQNPYGDAGDAAKTHSRALNELYRVFPRGSVDRTANYGVAAVLQYREIARASGDSLRRFVVLARFANAGFVLVLAWLMMLLRSPGSGRFHSAFVAFHPLVLVESIAFAHGDILMLVLLCAALVAYRKRAIEVCAVLIALAMQVRVIAGLALLVLLMKAAQERDARTVLRAVSASALTVAATMLFSIAAYGRFTLGGSPALGPYTSPLLLAFNAAAPSLQHIAVGGALQALLGLAILARVMLAKKYDYVPLTALTVLPIVRAWYCQWLVPLLAIERGSNAASAAGALAGIAIVTEWPEMTGHSDAVTWAVILCLQWILPSAALLYAMRNNTRPLKAPIPATSAP